MRGPWRDIPEYRQMLWDEWARVLELRKPFRYEYEIITKLPNLLQQNNPAKTYSSYGITDKECEIISKIADGLSNKEIADTGQSVLSVR